MSKRKNSQPNVRSVADFFAPKRKAVDDNEENSDSELSSSSNPKPTQSKQNHKVLFDMKIEQVAYANGIDWTLLFDFDFLFAGTSSNQIDVERGETSSTSKLKIHIEGAATYENNPDDINVKFNVRVGDNGES